MSPHAHAPALTPDTGRRQAEVESLLADLIAAASEAGSTGEAAQQVCARYLRAAGYGVTLLAENPAALAGHPEYTPPSAGCAPINLVAAPPRSIRPPLVFLSHIDTEATGASTAPRADRRGRRIHGPGAADAKGGLAAALVAAAILSDAGEQPPVVLSVHAKGGGARGTLPAFARAPRLGGVIYVHPAETGRGLTEIKHATRGLVDFQLTVQGWHGDVPEIGTPASARWAEGGDALAACLRVVDALRAELPSGCELNVGRLMAGETAGTVPVGAVADIRALFDQPVTANNVEAVASQVVARQRVERGGRRRCVIDIAVERRANPASTDWNSPLCLMVRTAVAQVTGSAPSPDQAHLGSDLRFPVRIAEVPAVGLGPTAGGFYGPDEWVDIDDLQRTVRVLVEAARSWNAREQQ